MPAAAHQATRAGRAYRAPIAGPRGARTCRSAIAVPRDAGGDAEADVRCAPVLTVAPRPALASACAFAGAARAYWTAVYPLVRDQLRRLAGHAAAIPDAQLRHDAFAALGKRGNLEGAAAFATFAPSEHRGVVVRASVAFQAAYDYLDVLAERPHADPVANASALNAALMAALSPAGSDPDFYALHARHEDGGYLAAQIAACRDALAALPSWPAAADVAHRAVERVVDFQGLNFASAGDRPPALAAWAWRSVQAAPATRGDDAPTRPLAWWELAASAGSSLALHALIAAAADASLDEAAMRAIECAYEPIGALHTLLDQLVDVQEDERAGQPNLTRCYDSPAQTAAALGRIAARARASARELDTRRSGLAGARELASRRQHDGTRRRGQHARRPGAHELLLAAMAANYLSLPQARSQFARPARRAVLTELGQLARASILVFKGRRLAARS